MKEVIWCLMAVLLFAGCVAEGVPRYDETDLNSDLEYSALDGRWYHKNPPRARDAMNFFERRD